MLEMGLLKFFVGARGVRSMVSDCYGRPKVGRVFRRSPLRPHARDCKDRNNRTPPLTFRTPFQILPHTNSYFHCLYSYLDLRQ